MAFRSLPEYGSFFSETYWAVQSASSRLLLKQLSQWAFPVAKVAPGTSQSKSCFGYLSVFGAKTIEVSIHEPQLQPPPPSGESNSPAAGIVLSQQSGRRRFQLVVLPFFRSHMVTFPERKNMAFSVAAYVPQPPPGSWSFSDLPSASDRAPGRT